jgi:integrase
MVLIIVDSLISAIARVVDCACLGVGTTKRPVQFEITAQMRFALEGWVQQAQLRNEDFLFPSRLKASKHLSTRQHSRIVKARLTSIGLDPVSFGPHTMRRTKDSLIYQRTKNIRAVQILLGPTKLESIVRYLGIAVDDTLEMAEQIEV